MIIILVLIYVILGQVNNFPMLSNNSSIYDAQSIMQSSMTGHTLLLFEANNLLMSPTLCVLFQCSLKPTTKYLNLSTSLLVLAPALIHQFIRAQPARMSISKIVIASVKCNIGWQYMALAPLANAGGTFLLLCRQVHTSLVAPHFYRWPWWLPSSCCPSKRAMI